MKKERIRIKRELGAANKGKAIGLNDIYPVGDLAGATVHEAILHNHYQVRRDVNDRKVILNKAAIKALVDLEMNKSSKKGF